MATLRPPQVSSRAAEDRREPVPYHSHSHPTNSGDDTETNIQLRL